MKFKDINTGQIFDFSIDQILEEINRNRSEEWMNYDKTDWQDGLEWTDFRLIK